MPWLALCSQGGALSQPLWCPRCSAVCVAGSGTQYRTACCGACGLFSNTRKNSTKAVHQKTHVELHLLSWWADRPFRKWASCEHVCLLVPCCTSRARNNARNGQRLRNHRWAKGSLRETLSTPLLNADGPFWVFAEVHYSDSHQELPLLIGDSNVGERPKVQ